MRNVLTKTIGVAVVALGLSAGVKAGDFTHDFTTDPAADGVVFGGNAKWVPAGYVSLTDALGGQQGKMLLPDFDSGAAVDSFTATMKIRIDGSTCCGPTAGRIQPADGMSFNFANSDDPAVTAVTDGGAGWTALAAEEGTTTGLAICIDTWDNGGGEAPNLDVKVNGTIVATARFDGNIFRNAEGFLTPRPYVSDGMGGNLDPRTPDGNWAPLEIRLSACGGVTVIYKGITIFEDLPTGLVPGARRFLMGGRTGGANDNHWVDDIAISTTPDALGAVVTARVPSARFDVAPDTLIGFTITENLNPVLVESIKLFVDGAEIPTADFTVTTQEDPVTQVRSHIVSYDPPNPLSANTLHNAVLQYKDVFAGPEDPPTCEVKNEFTTGGGVMLFIEAEDYNYSDSVGVNPGQYVDFGAPDGSLLNKVGTPEIDYHDNNVANDADNCCEYRPLDQVEAGKGPNNGGDQSRDRGGRTIAADWVIGWTGAGEWANYTRTFPNAAYRAFVRWGSDGGDNVPMNLALDEVISDPTQPNQTLRRLGTFHRDTETGGWDGFFVFTPLLDATGQPAAVRLNGKKTLRATVGVGAMDYNYIVFLPDPTVGVLRANASPSPANGATTDERDPQIKVVFSDRDTAVVPSSIRLTVNGTDVTGSSVITDTAGGAEITYNATYPLAAVVNATVQWTDDDATPVTQTLSWSFTTGYITPETLFIEAEDYNYTQDGVSGLFAEFGAPDGSLQGKVGTQDIDYNDPQGNDADDCCEYRPMDGVEAGKGPNNGGDQSRLRGTRTITADWVIGWTGAGEWHNYTRTFPNQRYYVVVRWGSGAALEDDMFAELGVVTSDPGQANQSVDKVGEFFRTQATGGWDGAFVYTPLRNAAGELATIKINGKGTLRYTVRPGAHDVNYLALTPAPPQASAIASVSPPVSREWPNPYAPLVTAVIEKNDSTVSAVKLLVDGVDRTADATVSETAARYTISVQLTGNEGERHSATVEWQDSSAGAKSHTWNFRQGPNYSVDNLFIELEDFNTGGGVYYPSAAGVDFNTKGLYAGLGAVSDVDFHDSGNPEEDQYRNGEVPNIGIVPHNDANRNGAGARPGFEVVSDYKMGWTDPGGDWYNYTRVFPAGDYHVWARISHGDGNATMGGQLDLVTSDRSQPNQTLQMLGEFVAPASGNWDGFTFVPMTDAAGDLVNVTSPGGEFTLRYSVKRNGGDMQYLMLTPAGVTLTCPANIAANTDAGQCTATVNYATPGGASCSPASGSAFPVGATTVTCTAGGQTCTFTVTVTDTSAPTINCPANLIVGNDAGQCSAVVSDLGVSAVDCPGTTLTCSPAAGSTFPVGSTAVTCTATDAAGNTASCTFNVTVEDREAPVVVVRNGANPSGKIKAKAVDNNGFFTLAVADNCDTAPKIYVKDANSSFVAGPYSNGTSIKLVANSLSNKTLDGANEVDVHINIAGDAQIYATDSAGNVSQPIIKQ